MPDTFEKLALVGDANHFEAVGDSPQSEVPRTQSIRDQVTKGLMSCITEVSTPKGRKPILKAMVTTACERGCNYCPFRAGRSEMRRVTFSPDELAKGFDQLERAGVVDGMFLSSGIIKGGATTQDKIIDTAEIVRKKYKYQGYIHLKIMPGVERDQLERAMRLADRVSINLEGATADRLKALAPQKDFDNELLSRIQWAHEIKQATSGDGPRRIRASIVTQFVVGAVGDTDLELLSLSDNLYRQMGLKRAYYSRFNPISNTPFESLAPVQAIRERRLYQAGFLLRDYGWDVEELPFEQTGNLNTDRDPKLVWADIHLRESPLELMTATWGELLRVPGIGVKGAKAIIAARRKGSLNDLSHLRGIGIRNPARSAAYILLDGRRPPQQLPLF